MENRQNVCDAFFGAEVETNPIRKPVKNMRQIIIKAIFIHGKGHEQKLSFLLWREGWR